jgi:hypothetical protein
MALPIRFQPWGGDRYREGVSGIRTLVLGEAHYGTDGGHSEVTRNVIREWAIEVRYAFFTKIVKLVLNLPRLDWVSDTTRQSFWNSVAFYNYVQEYPGPMARYRPSERMWQEAAPAFLNVLSALDPAAVIVLGFELWDRLPIAAGSIDVHDHRLKVYAPV